MPKPTRRKIKQTIRAGLMRGPDWSFSIQPKVRTSSAVSKTAGMTVENESELRKKYSRPVKLSPPKYSQFFVRQLITSNSHQAGAEHRKRRTKSFLERVTIEVLLRVRTSPSMARI
jgi:hypothetical protein